MSLVLLNDYKEILHIEGSDEDEFIGILSQEVEALVKDYLNWEIEAKDYVEYYDGTGWNYLVMNNSPIIGITKIEVYEGLDESNQETWTELTLGVDYERKIISDSALILQGYNFIPGDKNYRITYSAGYEECPYVIQNACKKLMKLFYDELKKSDSVGISSISQGANFSRNIVFEKDETKRILDKISMYRKTNI